LRGSSLAWLKIFEEKQQEEQRALAQQKGTKKKGKAKQEMKQGTLACSAPLTQLIRIAGGKMTAVDLVLQLQSQTALYLSVSGPGECGSKLIRATFRPQEKALDWDARVAKYATHPSVCHMQPNGQLVLAETVRSSSADYPPGSDEEFWTKEMGQALEVRLVQLDTSLTKCQGAAERTNEPREQCQGAPRISCRATV